MNIKQVDLICVMEKTKIKLHPFLSKYCRNNVQAFKVLKKSS